MHGHHDVQLGIRALAFAGFIGKIKCFGVLQALWSWSAMQWGASEAGGRLALYFRDRTFDMHARCTRFSCYSSLFRCVAVMIV